MKIISGLYIILAAFVVFSCSPSSFITRSGKQLTTAEGFKNAHVGISVYDVARKKELYSYQADKYFIPASNTKLFTLYAGLKYLEDSLPAIRYKETADSFIISPTGDPSFLHPGFKNQPLVEWLQKIKKPIYVASPVAAVTPFGMGWAWDDYNSSYMAERSALPVYGNLVHWIQSAQESSQMELAGAVQTFVFSEPDINWKVRFIEDTTNKNFYVKRKKEENYFEVYQGKEALKEQFVPFITNGISAAIELLKDTIHQEITVLPARQLQGFQTFHTLAADSLYKPMLHESDNFFAEQVLLMAAGEKLHVLDEEKMISYLLTNDLKDLPQKPRWVDGSGLSRYNLMTPSDFVTLLNKLQSEFTLERLKTLLPSGNEGTLQGYYVEEKNRIYAKTGTLSANVALSGLLITKKNKLLLFSVLVNNHQTSASAIRRQIEKFITGIIDKY